MLYGDSEIGPRGFRRTPGLGGLELPGTVLLVSAMIPYAME